MDTCQEYGKIFQTLVSSEEITFPAVTAGEFGENIGTDLDDGACGTDYDSLSATYGTNYGRS